MREKISLEFVGCVVMGCLCIARKVGSATISVSYRFSVSDKSSNALIEHLMVYDLWLRGRDPHGMHREPCEQTVFTGKTRTRRHNRRFMSPSTWLHKPCHKQNLVSNRIAGKYRRTNNRLIHSQASIGLFPRTRWSVILLEWSNRSYPECVGNVARSRMEEAKR